MIVEEGKRHYVLIKNVNTFMHNHTLHRGRKHFCFYCLQAFSKKRYYNVTLQIALKLIVNNGLECAKKQVC